MREAKDLILFDLYHFRISLAKRELVSANAKLDRISERCNLANVYLNASRYSHIHYSTLNSALAVKLDDLCRCANLYLFKRSQ